MKDKKMLYGIGIVFLFLASVGFSYAYFTASIANKDVKDQVVTTGTLELTYTDGSEIKMLNIKPGQTITKKVTVKNTGTLDTAYNFVWQELNNTITNDEMVISATCKRLNGEVEEETCDGVDEAPIKENIIKKNISIEPGITHEYNVTITFKEINAEQNYNQGKTFSGVLGINEYKKGVSEPVYCTFDGELVQGAEYTNGQYDYRYKQVGGYSYSVPAWYDSDIEGWAVQYNDRNSGNAVVDKVCTYINDIPVVSYTHMFYGTSASSVDLSGLDTSNVTDMSYMFYSASIGEIKGLESIDTSKVTDMSYMFRGLSISTLDLNGLDTSSVTNMRSMFDGTEATTLDLSNLNTSKVDDMSSMFRDSKATALDLTNFDTSNVTSMYEMFRDSQATTLNLSKLNTSKVTSMGSMFYGSHATTLDLSSFDTSNVTSMYQMFEESRVATLDLSYFDTSKVTNMSYMFDHSQTKTIYVSNKFNTNKVTSHDGMFSGAVNLVGGAGTKYNSSYVDKTYARIDGGTALPGYFTSKN